MILRRKKFPLVTDLPSYITIEPTSECNLKCIMCSRQHVSPLRDSHTMSLEDFRGFVAQFPRLTDLTFAGYGEPFVNPHLVSMIRYGKEKGLSVRVITNGKLLPRINPRTIIESGLDRIDISIHAAEPETFRHIRGEDDGHLEEVRESVHTLARERLKDGGGPVIVINIVAMKPNLKEIPRVIDWAIHVGADEVSIARLTVFGRGARAVSLEKSHMKELVRYKREGEKKGMTIIFCDRGDCCYDLWNHIIIKADGNVIPCVGLDSDFSLGNLHTISAGELWNSPAYQGLRRGYLSGILKECRRCAQGEAIEGSLERLVRKFRRRLPRIFPL